MNNQAETVAHNISLQSAGKWLLNSGIQNNESDYNSHGGMHAWFDLDTKTFSFLYPEITGYAVNIFLFLYDLFPEEQYLFKAKKAAQWLLETYQENPWVPNRVSNNQKSDGYLNSHTFTFDNWIVVYGLARLYEVTGKEVYLNKALEIADFLICFLQKENGMFYPLFNAEKMEPEETNDKWSRQSGSFHAKAIFALLKLHQITQGGRFYESAERLTRAVLSLQEPDGRFITHDVSRSTLLHPHLYTLEGLACFGFIREDVKSIEAIQKGVEWILKYQNENGSCYCFFQEGKFRPYIRVDVLAQTLRMGSILVLNKKALHLQPHLAKLRDSLIRYQFQSGAQQGGFLYGQEENGISHNHVNSWVTMFATQALWLYDFYLKENRNYNFDYFV